MSHVVTRAGAVGDDGKQAASPVKEMKKKMAANAEKEKQAAEKSANNEKQTDKQIEKSVDKHIDKQIEKQNEPSTNKQSEKHQDKHTENHNDRHSEKPNKQTEKQNDKQTEKQVGKNVDQQPEKEVDKKREKSTEKNMVKTPSESVDPKADKGEKVKSTRTPETPKPTTDKQTDKEAIVNGDDKSQENSNSTPKDTKLLKSKDDVPSSDRRLRSADRHTPDIKESESKAQENGQDSDLLVVEVDEAEIDKVEDGRRKTDTNYAKSRVKVSPYRRSARAHDHTATSTAANYTGNNTTMEMDITESFTERPSASEDPSLMDDSYVGGLRNIKGRKSYKQLKELSLKELAANRSKREAARANLSVTIESRPTGHVVGRKRRPADDEQPQIEDHINAEAPGVKRMRLVERVFSPFIRKTVASSTPLPARRAAPIVGINTDLPLSAPTAAAETFDPETLKAPQQVNPDPVTNKRCCIQ